jgi:hypothetical protein
VGVQAGVVTRVWLDQRIDQRVVCLYSVSNIFLQYSFSRRMSPVQQRSTKDRSCDYAARELRRTACMVFVIALRRYYW